MVVVAAVVVVSVTSSAPNRMEPLESNRIEPFNSKVCSDFMILDVDWLDVGPVLHTLHHYGTSFSTTTPTRLQVDSYSSSTCLLYSSGCTASSSQATEGLTLHGSLLYHTELLDPDVIKPA